MAIGAKLVPDGMLRAIKGSARYLDSGAECLTWSQVERVGVAVVEWLKAEEKRRKAKVDSKLCRQCHTVMYAGKICTMGTAADMFCKPELAR